MKLVHLGIISTGTIIVLGVAMIAPAFTQREPDHSIPSVMLFFSITDPNEASDWCRELASILNKHEVRASLFISGRTAESHPECVTTFSSDIDIGSQTYTYTDLTLISDYSEASAEIEQGKRAIDDIGALNSRLFKAPYGRTDDNIYSLLNRANIVADYSYVNHYNKYENNQFIKYDLKVLSGNAEGLKLFSVVASDDDVVRPYNSVPIVINFDNSISVEDVDNFVSKMKSEYRQGIQFVNVSDVIGQDVTGRRSGVI